MTDILMWLVCVENAVVLVAAAIVMVKMVKGSAAKLDMALIQTQISTAELIGFLTLGVDWFLVSCQSRRECMEGYMKLSEICGLICLAWAALGIAIMIGIFCVVLKKKDKVTPESLGKMRNSAFGSAIIYLVCSFLLYIE